MGAKSQRKGRQGELELCRLLNDHGIPATPGDPLNYGKMPDVLGVEGFHVEVKRAERLQIPAWMEQAERDAAKFGDGWPCVIHRRSREEWQITMPLTAWLELYKKSNGG